MESAQNLKRRIRSVQNIGQITKAMEMVAATKMRRAQEIALASRPYSYTALELLGILSKLGGEAEPLPALLKKRPVKKTAFMIVTSDKGLAGSFNGAVIRAFERYIKENRIDPRGPEYSFIAVGQKAKSYLERRKMRVGASFTRVGDFTKLEEVTPIADALISGYLREDFDQLFAFFTTFVTALRQDAVFREFLPIDYEAVKLSIKDTIPRAGRYSEYAKTESFFEDTARDYIIEPSPAAVLAELAPELLKIRVYHAILEANASEHSARRMAMKSASDNASELSEDLNLVYNKSRQASITRELTEITAGAEALH
ncbi:MAG TPA: ATP synthase F1 subunit gamma [Candidatus Paceibacterota bacterium]|nr:ATP synthase F1 subunit gamma [Candidatus Paceibacterota bacterium]